MMKDLYKKVIFRIIGTASFLLFLLISGCGQRPVNFARPVIDVSPDIENGKIILNILHRDINGILGLIIEDEAGKELWNLRTSYEQGNKIVYGELPTGGNMPAKQLFPPEAKAPPDIRGKTIKIQIEYQFDDGFKACCSTYQKTIKIP